MRTIEIRPNISQVTKDLNMGAEPMFGEKPKTREQVHMAWVGLELVGNAASELGQHVDIPNIERIHFLEKEIFNHGEHGLGNYGGLAFAGSDSLAICVGPRAYNLAAVIEEAFHLATNHRHMYEWIKSNYVAREIGYNHLVFGQDFFFGLTEAATSILKRDTLQKNLPRLVNEFKLNASELKLLLPDDVDGVDYHIERKVTEVVARKIAEKSGISTEKANEQIIKGLFKGGYAPYLWLKEMIGDDDFEMLAYLGIQGSPSDLIVIDYFLNASCDKVAAIKACRQTMNPSTKRTYEESYQIFLDFMKRKQDMPSELIAA